MIARVLVALAALFGAAAASQAPEFVQQYRQQIAGAANELAHFVRTFDEDAARHNLTRHQALARYGESNDPFLDTRGRRVAQIVQRYESLTAHKQALEKAGPFARLYVFARDYDPEFVGSTYAFYEPAVPLTTEGALHAGAGLLGGLLVARLLIAFGRMFRRKPARSRRGAH